MKNSLKPEERRALILSKCHTLRKRFQQNLEILDILDKMGVDNDHPRLVRQEIERLSLQVAGIMSLYGDTSGYEKA